jgi:hypothetical protein
MVSEIRAERGPFQTHHAHLLDRLCRLSDLSHDTLHINLDLSIASFFLLLDKHQALGLVPRPPFLGVLCQFADPSRVIPPHFRDVHEQCFDLCLLFQDQFVEPVVLGFVF